MDNLRLFMNLLGELLLGPLALQPSLLHRAGELGAHLHVFGRGGGCVETVQLCANTRLMAVGTSIVTMFRRYQALAAARLRSEELRRGG